MQLRFEHDTDTTQFAQQFAPLLAAGDVVLLEGSIGAGKSHMARGIIRARLGENTDVPSPTFTLVQVYGEAPEIWHADLYRLGSVDEAIELGIEEAFESAICLIEWPDRLGEMRPEDALQISLTAGPDAHHAVVTGPESWMDRVKTLDLRSFQI